MRTMRDQRLSMRAATIYAPAMLQRRTRKSGAPKLFNCAFIVGLKPKNEDDQMSKEQEANLLHTIPAQVGGTGTRRFHSFIVPMFSGDGACTDCQLLLS